MESHEPSNASSDDGLIRRNGLVIAPRHEPILRAAGLDSLDALFAIDVGVALDKPGLPAWRQRRRVTLNTPQGERTYYLKRFSNPPAAACREAGRRGVRSVAGVERRWMAELAREEIPCVQPAAFGEEHRGGREIRSALLTEAAAGDSLERWVDRWTDADRHRIRSLIGPLARMVARLHERGFAHRDLYLCHVFHDPSAGDGCGLRLIDLQRMIRPRWGMRRWIVKDLAALNYSAPRRLASRADRVRWLKLYLGVERLDGSARRLIYRIAGRTLGIERRDRRRRRRERIE